MIAGFYIFKNYQVEKEYKVYTITFKDTYFYIGITFKELNVRLREHYLKPISPAMKLFLSNTKPENIRVDVIAKGLSRREAELKEASEIRSIYNAGWKERLLNVYRGGHRMTDSLGASLNKTQADKNVKKWTIYGDLNGQTPHIVHKPDYKPRCPNCDQIKPLSEFDKDGSKGSGHRSWCKECTIKSRKELKIENLKRNQKLYQCDIDKFPVGTKVCSKCKKEKPNNSFTLNWSSKQVIRSLCKSCECVRKSNYYHKYKNRQFERVPDDTPVECTACKIIKLASEYRTVSVNRKGISYVCYPCESKRNRENYKKRRDLQKQVSKSNNFNSCIKRKSMQI